MGNTFCLSSDTGWNKLHGFFFWISDFTLAMGGGGAIERCHSYRPSFALEGSVNV